MVSAVTVPAAHSLMYTNLYIQIQYYNANTDHLNTITDGIITPQYKVRINIWYYTVTTKLYHTSHTLSIVALGDAIAICQPISCNFHMYTTASSVHMQDSAIRQSEKNLKNFGRRIFEVMIASCIK